ncbi:hypothetical protein [Syntrophus aciditrophicus]|nr:hypothetical protein [Syntrophus aciditrophicus]
MDVPPCHRDGVPDPELEWLGGFRAVWRWLARMSKEVFAAGQNCRVSRDRRHSCSAVFSGFTA